MRDQENMYNVDTYSDKELMDILDLFNPTDRELEMKIIYFIRKYDSFQNEEGNRLSTFFREIYGRFFHILKEDGDGDGEKGSGSGSGSGSEENHGVVEGFGTDDYVVGGGKQNESIITTDLDVLSDVQKIGSGSGSGSGPSVSAATDPTSKQIGYDVQFTTALDYAKGKLNPLLKETVKRIISIDSQYRDSSKSLSTDFTMNFNEILRDVVSLKLYAVQIPYTWYTISQNYGSNFLYIKGISPGINDGNHDFKITIDPGNYDQNSLTTAIQKSISGLPLLYPDISFGSTQLIYNNTSCYATYQIDIQNVYNQSNYALYFDGPLYYPSSNLNRSRYLSSFLGFNYANYSFSSVFSSRKITSITGLLENTNSKYIFNSSNSVIKIIQYTGSNTIYQTLNISFPITGGGLTQKGVFDTINSVLSLDNRFVNASIGFSQITGMDVCGNTIDSSGNYRFQLNFKWNRALGNNIPESKLRLELPSQETVNIGNSPIWIGSNACFSFDQSYNEMNTLISESVVSSSDFKIIGNVYYSFVLQNTNYNVNGVNDLSYALTNSFSGYSLTNYLAELNKGIDQMNSKYMQDNSYNLFIIGNDNYGNIYNKFYIDNKDSKIHINVNMSRYFFTENYVIDISNTLMNTLFGITTTDLNVGVDLSFGVVKTGSFRSDNFFVISTTDTLLMKVYANPKNKNGLNPNRSDLSYNIYLRPGTYYSTPQNTNEPSLKAEVDRAFREYVEPSLPSSNPFANMSFSYTLNSTNIYTSQLTIGIEKVILEDEYRLNFYDVSNDSWNRYLNFDSSYSLGNYTRNEYADISGNDTILNDIITLDSGGATFRLSPLDISSGDISFNIPSGIYTRSGLFQYMNQLFSLNPITIGTTISAITVGEDDYTKIQWSINKVYTSSDYQLVFYDLFSFVSCYLGNNSVRNATWDTTLGWITGFTSLIQYPLTAANIYTDINRDKTFYMNTISPYTVNYNIPYRTIVNLTGDTTVSVNSYKYFMVILDDFNQNHLNDGLVTITPKDNNLELPSYANRYSSICDPTTGQVLNVGITDPASNKLTQNQIYSLNQIIQTQNTAKGYTSGGVFVKDIFGLIPIKTSGLSPGSTYVELGGTLQNQDRIYFGPVNIHRMAIKLVNDRGDIVDLNGSNWSLQFVCEQLYQTSFSNNITSSSKN